MLVISYDIDEVLDTLDVYEGRSEKIVVVCNHKVQMPVLETLYKESESIRFINPDTYDFSIVRGLRPQVLIVLNPHTIDQEWLRVVYSGLAAIPNDWVAENARRKLLEG